MLGEHGFFGLVALIVLVAMMAGTVRRGRGPLEKAVAASLVLWAASFLMVNAMRTAAPSFIVGLVSASLHLSALRPRMGRQGTWRRRPAITGRAGHLRTIPAAARLHQIGNRT